MGNSIIWILLSVVFLNSVVPGKSQCNLGETLEGQCKTYLNYEGRYLTVKDGLCTTAGIYADGIEKKQTINLGGYSIFYSTDKWVTYENKAENTLQCWQNVTQSYDTLAEKVISFEILGTFKFSEPKSALVEGLVMELPLLKSYEGSPSLYWGDNTTAVPLWYTLIRKDKGYDALWVDTADEATKPSSDKFERGACDQPLESTPDKTKDCGNFWEKSEHSFNLVKDYIGTGKLQDFLPSDPSQKFELNAKTIINAKNKLNARWLGDPKYPNERRKFFNALWTNETGGYYLESGLKCEWDKDLRTDNVAVSYGGDQIKWIGRAEIKDFKPASAKGLTVNIHAGITLEDEPLIIYRDHGSGNLRGMDYLYPQGPIRRIWYDTVKLEEPALDLFTPDPSCPGADKFFDGIKDMTSGFKVMKVSLGFLAVIVASLIFQAI